MTALDDVNGTICSMLRYDQLLEIAFDGNVDHSVSCLTHGQCIGLALIAEASFISFISVVVIFIWIGWNVRWYRKTFPNGDWKLFQRPADIYMFSLFLFDLLQAIGGILDTRWAHRGIVTTGHYCTAQGIILQIGEVGIALISVLLAVHTFVAALWQVSLQARGAALGMVCLVWVFIAVWVIIGAGLHKYNETPTPYWCWISPKFQGMRLYEQSWLYTAIYTSELFYIPLYFWAKGRLSVDEVIWYKFHMSRPDRRAGYAQRRVALMMLLYPVATCLVLLPLVIPRWAVFSHHNAPSAAVFFGGAIFHLCGVVDVLLFLIARPQLLLFPRPERLAESDTELAPQCTSSAVSPDMAKFHHVPESTSAVLLVDEGSRNSAAQFCASSRRLSDDV